MILNTSGEYESRTPVFEREVNIHQLYGAERSVNPQGLLVQLSDISRRAGHEVYMIASDMDGTMVDGDIGTVVILRLMASDLFYTNAEYDFEANLKSRDFMDGYTAVKNSNTGIEIGSPDDGVYIADSKLIATWVLDVFVPQFIDLYRKIQSEIRLYGSTTSDADKNRLISQFDILDLITMKMETAFKGRTIGGMIPKTRFFAGLPSQLILDTVKPMFDLQNEFLNMDPQDIEIFDSAPGLMIHDRIKNTPISLHVDKVVGVRRLIRMATELNLHDCDRSLFNSNTRGGATHIVTTNDEIIARFVATHNPWKKVFDEQLKRFPASKIEEYIHATRLAVRLGIIQPILQGEAVLADRKRVIAEEIKPLVAFGDTFTDVGMMITAIKNGGYAILVGPDLELCAIKFEPAFASLTQEERERIFFIKSPGSVRYA